MSRKKERWPPSARKILRPEGERRSRMALRDRGAHKFQGRLAVNTLGPALAVLAPSRSGHTHPDRTRRIDRNSALVQKAYLKMSGPQRFFVTASALCRGVALSKVPFTDIFAASLALFEPSVDVLAAKSHRFLPLAGAQENMRDAPPLDPLVDGHRLDRQILGQVFRGP